MNFTSTLSLGAAPAAPDYTQLKQIGQGKDIQAALDAAMKIYDDSYASTQALGFQAASSAGKQYSGRLMQQGINPVASGVVEAQAKLPVYKQLHGIKQDQATTKADFAIKAQSLAAQVAQSIAQLQLGYSNTLADYNAKTASLRLQDQGQQADNFFKQAGLTQNQNQFNTTSAMERQKIEIQRAIAASQIANTTANTQGQQLQNTNAQAVNNLSIPRMNAMAHGNDTSNPWATTRNPWANAYNPF